VNREKIFIKFQAIVKEISTLRLWLFTVSIRQGLS